MKRPARGCVWLNVISSAIAEASVKKPLLKYVAVLSHVCAFAVGGAQATTHALQGNKMTVINLSS